MAPTITPTPPVPTPTVSPTLAPTAVIDSNLAPLVLWDNPSLILGNSSTWNHIGSLTNTPIDNIACTGPLPTLAQHFHDHISFFVNGAQYAIPAAIGIFHPTLLDGPASAGWYNINPALDPSACHYDIHIHADSGVIHIETPSAAQHFTLKNFLDIWGVTINPLGFLGFTGPTHWYLTNMSNALGAGKYTVVDITYADPATIVLSGHLELTVEVGTPVNIPNYQWVSDSAL